MTYRSVFKKALLAAVILSIFTSCNRKLGYGYLLWSPEDNPFATGAPLIILSESKINDTYLVQLEGNKDKIEIPKWRILFFEKEEQMQIALENYSAWNSYFAENLKQGLPIRSEPDSHSNNTIYKLREGQQIKVISRQAEKVSISDLDGYWYEVLTGDGVRGWVFDYFLQIYQMGNDQTIEIQNDDIVEDPLLKEIYNKPFFPSNFEDMIHQQTIDLNKMKEAYHFIINEAEKKISIRTKEYFLEKTYEEAVSTAYHTYNFIGSSFRLEASSPNLISLQFNYDGTEIKLGMVQLDKPMDEILQEERLRRQALADEFIEKGPLYNSDTYGKIEFQGQQRFFWINKSILISQNLLSAETGNQGNFSFTKFLGRDLRSKYDGVITLNFDNGETLNFLFKQRSTGVLMLYIPNAHIERGIINTDRVLNPMQIFFQAVPQETE